MNPGAGIFVLGHGHTVKKHYFFSSFLGRESEKFNINYSNDVHGIYQAVNFISPKAIELLIFL